MKKGLCAACRGSRTQHTLDEEGCWCHPCLMGAGRGEVRCQEFVESTTVEKPTDREERHMRKMHDEELKLRRGSRQREVFVLVQGTGENGMLEEELEDMMCRPVRAYVQELRNRGLMRTRGTRTNKYGVQSPVYVSWQHIGAS